MHIIKACRACLITNVKLHSMDDSFIYNAYLKIIGFELKSLVPEFVCYECFALLKRFEEFRSKCMRAHLILMDVIKNNVEVNQDVFLNVDRKGNKLESPLIQSETKSFNWHPDVRLSTLDLFNDYHDNVYHVSVETVKEEDGNDFNDDDDDVPLQMVRKNNAILNDVYDLHKTEKTIIVNSEHNMILPSNADDDDNVSIDSNTETESLIMIPNGTIKERKVSKANKHKNGITIKKKRKKVKNDHKQSSKRKVNLDVNSLKIRNKEKKTHRKKDMSKNESIKKGSRPSLDESFFEGYATIVVLTPEQAKQEVLQRKDSSNYINCQFKCDLCYRGFEAQSTYENHMKKHSPESGPHECAYCHMRFPGLSVLCRHRQSCHKRKFYCQICPYTCFCSHQAKIHVNLHKGKKYPCNECGELFSMPNSLLMHKRIKHATECVCELCGSTFTNERGLRSHKKMLHRQETNAQHGPSCEECGVQFSNETAWKRHLVLSSKHGVSNGCETCGETFPDGASLKEHVRTHTRRRHASASATAVCVCEVCGKTFKELCFLVLHQRTHTGERPFHCEECGKAFPSAAALTSHRDTHTTTACYRCQMCTKQFTFRSSLYRHMKISHLGFRPHKCNMCEKTFPTPCQVRLHTKYVHDKVPWPKRERRRPLPEAPDQQPPYYDNTLETPRQVALFKG